MISTKRQVQQLAAILHAKGIHDVVISPGSRNGPLISTFAGCGLFHCKNVVDERSAAYFALGIAQAKQKPVAIVCSSGTATLNFAPAVAEAFYQNVPLLIITADRPDYWIDQADNQCIQQKGIYRNFIKSEFSLPLGESEQELWFANRKINEGINVALNNTQGPVHFNVPLEEPLHDLLDDELPSIRIINTEQTDSSLSPETIQELVTQFNRSKKVLILAGQEYSNSALTKLLDSIVQQTGAVVLKEHLANLYSTDFCSNIDALMAAISSDKPEDFQPNLLISFGGQFVSKALKQFLRKNKASQHWHLSPSNQHFDTYQSLTKVISCDAFSLFQQLHSLLSSKEDDYLQRWRNKENAVIKLRKEYITKTTFSDLTAINKISNALPQSSVLHLGNSSPVRYALICDSKENIEYYSNRGTSGIDGSLSTAVGFASESAKINTVLLGDLSFFYDSNALWNKHIKNNLRIIVINNRGGNIFGLIKGPGESPAFKEHFLAENNFEAKGLAKTYGLDYLRADDEKELNKALSELYAPERKTPTLLEFFTDAQTNAEIFQGLFNDVKQ